MLKPSQPEMLPHAPQCPRDPQIVTYTRFGTSFEAYEYTSWVDECMSWKTSCYIGDWSPLFKLQIKGPDAIQFFSSISVNNYDKFDIGQAKHTVLCNGDGKLMGEGVLMRQKEDEYLFMDGVGVPWMHYLLRKSQFKATATDVTADRFIFQIQGPNSLFVLEEALGSSIRDIGFMRFRAAEIDGMPLEILRQGMAGELGYELHGLAQYGIPIYNRLLEIGQKWGIHRLGGRTKMVNHVEACFPTPSVDYLPAFFSEDVTEFRELMAKDSPMFMRIMKPAGSYESENISDYYRSPIELGWSKNIKFNHDFLGREKLQAEMDNPRRTIVTLVWNKEDVNDVNASFLRSETPYQYMEMPRNALGRMWTDKVLKDGLLVGASTSRCYSYYFRDMISLCTIDVSLAREGTEVEILWGPSSGRQKLIRAIVAPAPYKKDNRKIDVMSLPSYL